MTEFVKQIIMIVVLAITYAIVFALTSFGLEVAADKLRNKANAWKEGFEE